MPRRLTRRERSIEAACCKYARDNGCIVLKLTPPPRGVPDRVVLLPGGKEAFIEFKRPGGKLRPAQARFIAELQLHGCRVMVFDDVSRFKRWLDECL